MSRGSDGLAGGGIYFAETQTEAEYKANCYPEYLLVACVWVGRWKKAYGAIDTTFSKLYSKGYDSVYLPHGAGEGDPEWVVYNSDQVKVMRMYRLKYPGREWRRDEVTFSGRNTLGKVSRSERKLAEVLSKLRLDESDSDNDSDSSSSSSWS
eukprot:TRINITY_DN43913_c0_g1_i1.p1 TRINITY_DN43913_c0_g1~~TRINITY_DN43913_c0_g1_i1.p1  ORF type:complete len:152 (-),score=22.50 TRINITY_DN43913_c0_g1_i1:283-738(-)